MTCIYWEIQGLSISDFCTQITVIGVEATGHKSWRTKAVIFILIPVNNIPESPIKF